MWLAALRWRQAWRGAVALGVLVGLVGGVAIAAGASARRTASAYPRFLARAKAPDVFVIPSPGQQLDLDEVVRLPQVTAWGRFAFAGLIFVKDGGPASVNPFAEVASHGQVNVPKVLRGRQADESRAFEVTVNPLMASRFRLRVGSRLSALTGSHDQIAEFAETGKIPRGLVDQAFRVVGIVQAPGDVASAEQNGQPTVSLTHAYYVAHRSSVMFEGVGVRLRRGAADVPAFKAEVEPLSNQPVPFETGRDDELKTTRAIHPQVLALVLFSVFSALVGGLVVGQALVRHVRQQSADAGTLAAIGMRPAELVAAATAGTGMIAGLGVTVAVAAAVALSPLSPIGLARQAVNHPGLSADWTALAVGGETVVALVLGCSAGAAWRELGRARRSTPMVPTSRVVERLARAGAPPAAVTGVRMAMSARAGGDVAPTWTAVVGAVVAIAGVVMAFTFGSSLRRVEHTPRLYGWTWDVALDGSYGPDLRATGVPALRRSSLVEGWVGIAVAEASVAGHSGVPTIATGPSRGVFFPSVLRGRPPRADEVLLGTRTWRRIGGRLGQRVPVSVAGHAIQLRLVGEGVLPAMGTTGQGLQGDGAVVTLETLRRLIPDPAVNIFLLRTGAHVSLATLGGQLSDGFPGVAPVTPQQPAELVDLSRVDYLPFVLAAILVALGVCTLAHAAVTAVRRERRQLAVLKALGFARRQLSATVAWQATTLAVLALAVGIPAGLAGARVSWDLFARDLGLVASPTMPLVPLLVLAPTTVLVANLVAVGPGRAARRVRPASILRAE
jgi:putative ABC transport system permease protein